MFSDLEQTFRWYGPNDAVTLAAIKQTGATGIVTALHHIATGEVWSRDEIGQRLETIKAAGLTWPVVESVNIHESIKTGSRERDKFIENYIGTLKNLSVAGIKTVCYNFMPVLDWTRTDIDYMLPNKASALRYDVTALAAFDLYILERERAYAEHSPEQQQRAKKYLDGLKPEEVSALTNTVMAGLPGTTDVLTVNEFKEHLKKYRDIDAASLKGNLAYFLKAIMPDAERCGIKMCIHPDDPPFPILGLPRVVSTEKGLEDVVNAAPSPSNGITFCTGSLGARGDNDLPGMVSRLGSHIHFLHLRNVQREEDGSFFEADHLNGSNDMYAIMKNVILEQKRRQETGRFDIAIPVRPDHGHKILGDFNYNTFPGYSVSGRMKGLAELRGLEMGIKRTLFG
jgi:mannonate dehydratase